MHKPNNSIRLIGNLGADPDFLELDGGRKLSKMSIATQDKYKNKEGEFVEQTEWHKVIAWGRLADVAQKFLSKGKQVAIEGKLMHRSYEDKEGNKRYFTEILASSILMLGKKAELN